MDSKEIKRIYDRNYYRQNQARIIARNKIWKVRNRLKSNSYSRAWNHRNRERFNAASRAWYHRNKAAIRVRQQRWQKLNRKRLNDWQRNALKTNIHFAIAKRLRGRLLMVLKRQGLRDKYSAMKLIGCDLKTLKNHLQSKFKPGMTWDNRGRWEIDHIKPCAKFDLKKIIEQKKCFHFLNLQPLWKTEKRQKKDKYVIA